MKKIISLSLIFILALSFTAWAETKEYDDPAQEGNVISADSGELVLTDIIVSKTGDGVDTKGSEYYDWYGHNAAILASGDGAVITIKSADISTSATYASAVFAYGGSIAITSASITTEEKNSGGIMVTGGGTILAEDVKVSTEAGSSAAIRSDKGGGSISAIRGTYTTNGTGSPAVYSTASITVSRANLTANNSQGVVIEGGNSVTLTSSDLSASHELNGQDKTHQAVLIYQSGSGDASEGKATFTMNNGSITNEYGDIFCVTNTSCDISISGVKITNNDSTGNFLRAESQNWGRSGSNGGKVTFTTNAQTIEGNIIVASGSSLNMTLKNSSSYSGAVNPGTTSTTTSSDEVTLAAAGGTVNVIIEKGSKWTLSGNSYITSLAAADPNDINYGTYTLNVGSNAYTASKPYGASSSSTTDSGSGGSTTTTPDSLDVTPTKKVIGPANVGCNAGYAGLALLACLAFMKRK